jgi:hypothetical protein
VNVRLLELRLVAVNADDVRSDPVDLYHTL